MRKGNLKTAYEPVLFVFSFVTDPCFSITKPIIDSVIKFPKLLNAYFNLSD